MAKLIIIARAHHSQRIVGPKGRGFSTFSPQGIGNTIWAFARQAQITNDVVQRYGLGRVNIGTTGRLAMYETSCLDIGEQLIKEVFVKAADAAINIGLDKFRSQGKIVASCGSRILPCDHI